MKTIPIMILTAALVSGCGEKKEDAALVQARQKILNDAVEARNQAERENKQLAEENSTLRLKLSDAENRLKIATDSAQLSDRLLDDSNEAKLRRARQMLNEATGK